MTITHSGRSACLWSGRSIVRELAWCMPFVLLPLTAAAANQSSSAEAPGSVTLMTVDANAQRVVLKWNDQPTLRVVTTTDSSGLPLRLVAVHPGAASIEIFSPREQTLVNVRLERGATFRVHPHAEPNAVPMLVRLTPAAKPKLAPSNRSARTETGSPSGAAAVPKDSP